MKDLLEVLGFVSAVLGIALVGVILIYSGIKVLMQGQEYTSGKVISISKGFTQDCIKISQTTEGESLSKRYCVYRDMQLPNIGNYIQIRYKRSAFIFMDKIEITPK